MKDALFTQSEQAEETLRLATEAAHIGVWDFHVASGQLFWSDFSKEIFGITKPGVLNLTDFLERLHPAETDRVQAAMQTALDPDGPGDYDLEYRICRPSAEQRTIHARGKVFFEGVGSSRTPQRFLGTFLDRTDQKLAHSALIQAEQLASTGRLAASIAHEINNPLEAITNLLYLLRDEVPAGPGREYLRQAESELARVSEIAANTLRFYRDPKGLTRVDISDLLHSVLSLFHGRMAVRGVALQFECEGSAHVLAQQGELRQVIVNLVGNALDAMPQGGRLRVRCRRFSQQIGPLQAGIEICIGDTGVGMTPEIRQRVFQPFFTTKGAAGTGLGLWLSLEILKKHGFELRVKSKPGEGSVFSIFMPEHRTADNRVAQIHA